MSSYLVLLETLGTSRNTYIDFTLRPASNINHLICKGILLPNNKNEKEASEYKRALYFT